MKITDLTITLHTWDVPRTVYTDVVGGAKHVGVVTIETDEGIAGHSFLGTANQGADEFAPQILLRLKPLLIGRDALDIGAIWGDLWRRNRVVAPQSICAVDVALWDIAGQAAGQPIHRLLGTCRERVPAYASSASMSRPEQYVEEAQAFRGRGWTAYKIHPVKRAREDVAICRAVRDALGDDLVLMLDAMWAYGYEDALRVGRAIEELRFFWYEDPLAEDDLYNYVKLKQKLDIPILATEYSPGGLYGFTSWITERATDMLRGDVALKAGITPMVKIAHVAEAFRLKCEIHHGGNSLNNVANLHVTMAIPNCDYFEVLQPDSAQKHGLVQDIEVDAQGFVHAPVAPGLGYEIDWARIRRDTVTVLR